MREIQDRCAPTETVYSAGRTDRELTFELYEFRWRDKLADLKAFHDAIANRSIVAVLALNDAKDQTEAWGTIGNYLIGENSSEEPEDGENSESYSLRPAADSVVTPVVRWIYGSDIP